MSVLIKGMDMPNTCLNCKFTDEKFTSLGVSINCNLGLGGVVGYRTGHHVGDRHPNCPLIELPEHHGGLIDADNLKMWFGEKDLYSYDYIIGTINDEQTVIEAE